MKNIKRYSNLQLITLVVLRIIVGWHLLYEGFAKLLNPSWSSRGFLQESQWILSGFSHWIASNTGVLSVVDFLNTWGLIAIGLALILGLFSRIGAISGAILLFIYYLNNPPLPGLEYSVPAEGNNLIINKTLIESLILFALALFPTSHLVGLDLFLRRNKKITEKENIT